MQAIKRVVVLGSGRTGCLSGSLENVNAFEEEGAWTIQSVGTRELFKRTLVLLRVSGIQEDCLGDSEDRDVHAFTKEKALGLFIVLG